MIRERRNAYLASLFLLVGVACLVVGTYVPAIELSPKFGLDFGHLSIAPSTGVDSSDAFPIMLSFGAAILILAVLLGITRRRGLGILWRILTALFVVIPLTITAGLWNDVANPADIATDSNLSLGSRFGGLLAAANLGDASPGLGLWLLTLGCLVILVGCLVPSKKRKELLVRDDDPGYGDFNPHIQQFQQHQYRQYEQNNTQRAQPGQTQTPPIGNPYGDSRYYGTE